MSVSLYLDRISCQQKKCNFQNEVKLNQSTETERMNSFLGHETVTLPSLPFRHDSTQRRIYLLLSLLEVVYLATCHRIEW